MYSGEDWVIPRNGLLVFNESRLFSDNTLCHHEGHLEHEKCALYVLNLPGYALASGPPRLTT